MNKVNFLVAILAFVFVQCGVGEGTGTDNQNNERRVRTVAVETITMEPDSFEETIKLHGTVEAFDDATISSEASGTIQYIAPLGKRVERGEVIARMDDRLLQAQYEAARVSYELALDTYRRQQVLYEDSIISELQYNNIRTQRDQAKAGYEQASKQLRDTRIGAPFTGRIEERFVRTGELINPGMPVARVVNTSRVKITAGVPERYSADVRERSPMTISIRAYGDFVRTGTISFAGNVVDSDTRTYPVEIEIPNPEGILKPEMVAELHILRKTIDDALVIPRTAIVRDEDGPNVFIVRYENGHPVAEFVPVRTGASSGLFIQILDGIESGDEIVVSGQRTLNQGDRLDILANRTSVEHVLAIRDQSNNR